MQFCLNYCKIRNEYLTKLNKNNRLLYLHWIEEKMDISIEAVAYEEKELLKNLLEKYEYEFSQYDDRDVNNFGLYGYKYLDHFWTDEGRYVYFIKINGKLAGFSMIRYYDSKYSISEFFVMYKYRKNGVGSKVMDYIFSKYKGKWRIGYTTRNETAKIFWNKIVEKYSNGKYETIENKKDGTISEELIFEII
jgi:predicted acetyltransferase